jgi:integrase
MNKIKYFVHRNQQRRLKMTQTAEHWTHNGASLFTHGGERKYLSKAERKAFYACIAKLPDPKAATFCETLYWTGCRPSEALALTALQVDFDEKMIVLRSLKKRGNTHFRPVPVPSHFLDRLKTYHTFDDPCAKLWSFGRTTAWKHVAEVMDLAGIRGARASARGLRHSMGVRAQINDVPINRIQRWLGHSHLQATVIYLDIAGTEDRELARRTWVEA